MIIKKKVILNFTLLCSSILLLILLGIFQRDLFIKIADIVGSYIWPTIIAVSTFLGFVVGGIIKHPPKSFAKFLDNTLVFIAILELFLFLAGLSVFAYFKSNLGQIELRLASGNNNLHINAIMLYHGDTTFIQIPRTLSNLKPGDYNFIIIEKDFNVDSQKIYLNPGTKETVILTDKINWKIIVNSKPEGAEIWIDGSLISLTPDTLINLEKNDVKLELRLAGYQPGTRNVNLLDKSLVNLGIIKLNKLYKLKIICQYNEMEFKLNGKDYIGSQKGILVPEGRAEIMYKTSGNNFQRIIVTIEKNETIFIP